MRDVQIGSAYKAALAGASGSQSNSAGDRAPLRVAAKRSRTRLAAKQSPFGSYNNKESHFQGASHHARAHRVSGHLV